MFWKIFSPISALILTALSVMNCTPRNSDKLSQPTTENKSVAKSPAERGADIFKSKGCFACHSVDGTPKVGPTFKGAFGHTVELQDGSKVMVDENYIRESILEPHKKIVKGFSPSMPVFKGILADDETEALVAFIKSLK